MEKRFIRPLKQLSGNAGNAGNATRRQVITHLAAHARSVWRACLGRLYSVFMWRHTNSLLLHLPLPLLPPHSPAPPPPPPQPFLLKRSFRCEQMFLHLWEMMLLATGGSLPSFVTPLLLQKSLLDGSILWTSQILLGIRLRAAASPGAGPTTLQTSPKLQKQVQVRL